jgi:glutamyl-tRNA synthetase
MEPLSDAVFQTARLLRNSGAPALFRLAPTPSGFLHPGNLFNFLLNWLTARLSGSRVLLRIDDLDSERILPAYMEALFRNLDDLGIDWDLGPDGPQDMAVWSQHRRMDLYREKIACLQTQGLVYACACSRKDFADGKPCHCRDAADPAHIDTLLRWKDMKLQGADWEDFFLGPHQEPFPPRMVLWRRDGLPAYQLASVCDDAHYGVTHVWRGADLLPSTAFQLQLVKNSCFAGMKELHFGHHPLLTDAGGDKISKSTGNQSEPLPLGQSDFRSALLNDFIAWTGVEIPVTPIDKLRDLLAFFVEKDSAV